VSYDTYQVRERDEEYSTHAIRLIPRGVVVYQPLPTNRAGLSLSLHRLQAFDKQITYAPLAALQPDEPPPTRPTSSYFGPFFEPHSKTRVCPFVPTPSLSFEEFFAVFRFTDHGFGFSGAIHIKLLAGTD
jgi:hypothetical protein